MKTNINNLRLNLAKTYNNIAREVKNTDSSDELINNLQDMRCFIGALLATYLTNDDGSECEDFKDLSDKIDLINLED